MIDKKNNSIYGITLEYLANLWSVLTYKVTRKEKIPSFNPLTHFEKLFVHNPEWYLLLARELFKNLAKYEVGHDLYESIFGSLNQAQIMSLIAHLSGDERRNWKHAISTLPEETSQQQYLNFLVSAITDKKVTGVRRVISYKLSGLRKKEIIDFFSSSEEHQQAISSYLKPSFFKALLEGMNYQNYQKALSSIVGKEQPDTGVDFEGLLLSRLNEFLRPPAEKKKIEIQDLFILMDSEKEHLYYRELHAQKRIDLLFDSLQKKIPLMLLKRLPVSVLKSFFEMEESWVMNYLESYRKDQRKELYTQIGLNYQSEKNLEAKIPFNTASDEEKFQTICRTTDKIFHLCNGLPAWDTTYQMLLANWTEGLNCGSEVRFKAKTVECRR